MPDSAVPVRRWRVSNFKSIQQADLPLSALNLLVGPNSGGKSSLLQSMLLACQAAQARAVGPYFPLNGGLVELGGFGDVKSTFAAEGDCVTVGGVFDLSTSWEDVSYGPRYRQQALFESDEPEEPRFAEWSIDLSGVAPFEPGAAAIRSVSVELRRGEKRSKRSAFRLDARERPDPEDELHRPDRVVPTARSYRSVYGHLGSVSDYSTFWTGSVSRGPESQGDVEGVSLVAGFPSQYLTRSEENREVARLWLDRAQQFAPRHEAVARGNEGAFEFVVARAAEEIAEWIRSVPSDTRPFSYYQHLRRTLPGRNPGIPSALLRQIAFDPAFTDEVVKRIGPGRQVLVANPVPNEACEQPLEILADNVAYLGPLRQEPDVVYRRTAPGRPRFLGSRGEFTAPVLHALRNEGVDVPRPGLPPGETHTLSLGRAMNEWLEFLEAATTIETRDKGRLGFELVVTQPGLSRGVDLTYVGVGVSQVVPVMLICLLSRPGSVVLLEQPELHLHPAMQQRLGDFFIALARTGRQLVVETHSEYLITRLRRRIAEDHGDDTADVVSIFNVSKDANGRTRCSNVPVDRDGSFVEWPDGFFDQASEDAERLLTAGLEKSSKRRGRP